MRVLIEMLKKCRLLSFPLLSTIWVSLKVSIKKWYCKGKKLFLTCRCVDKRERKLTVGNKLADSTTIHLTWLMFPDSYFYRDCAQEVVKKGALSCNSRAASANMLELILTLSYIQVAFYSSKCIYHLSSDLMFTPSLWGRNNFQDEKTESQRG